jgi:hypothetical protein
MNLILSSKLSSVSPRRDTCGERREAPIRDVAETGQRAVRAGNDGHLLFVAESLVVEVKTDGLFYVCVQVAAIHCLDAVNVWALHSLERAVFKVLRQMRRCWNRGVVHARTQFCSHH